MEQHIREGRFQRSLALIAGMASLLGGLEVAYEHYRGSYGQRIMYSPVLLSFPLTCAGVWGAFNRRVARTLLPIASLAVLVDGALGFFFHARGIQRKPGGWRIPIVNVVMGPPIFAPLLLGVSGFLGLIATFLRREDDPQIAQRAARTQRPHWTLPPTLTHEARGLAQVEHRIREGRFQRILAMATAISAMLNGVEALYSHYKNRFTYRVQWTPILLAPLVVIAGIGSIWSKTLARTLLPITALLALLDGAVGFFFHARGVLRQPGGLTQALYNVIYGPPIFAPLLYAATGFLGLLASLLRRAD